ncbi:DUF3089 domain-containing protein [Chondrinema litorale]|uniref:DUF3089 domain-containing protein n=1 Tax=Chondrinema litorale TaxID=2994555 RepID=UPI0025439BE3|nr:DUF3089 domain-containing protein [Chondrinema litorale]UZR93911.1 DUF3089 domain-containing protein [Chondrinema litorale]
MKSNRYTATVQIIILLALFSLEVFAQKTPEAPDYSDKFYWAALPTKKDWADYVPEESNFKDNQDIAEADVFFIHPTTALSLSTVKNARLDAKRFNHRTDFVMLNQASVFNGSCRVYAPRYRQVSLITFIKKYKNKRRTKVFNVAYSDVKQAFEYYLEHYNNGRPIIIAGHSQGSYHGIRLIQEFFEGKPLYDQLVAAYLIGNASTQPIKKFKEYKSVTAAQSETDTGCVISWNTYKKNGRKYPFYVKNDLCFAGEYGNEFYTNRDENMVVINPLNWKTDDSYAESKLNIGSTPFVRKPEKFKKINESLTDAQLVNGVLRVTKPIEPKYRFPFSGDYHVYDYNIFYTNIRENVALRLDAFQKKYETRVNPVGNN